MENLLEQGKREEEYPLNEPLQQLPWLESEEGMEGLKGFLHCAEPSLMESLSEVDLEWPWSAS